MKCPHCNKDIKEEIVLQESARIMGRRSKRKLTHEQAVETGRLGGLKKAANKKLEVEK